jgi:hypothetical protein
MVLPKPKDLTHVQAAALPENWMTGELSETGARMGKAAKCRGGCGCCTS